MSDSALLQDVMTKGSSRRSLIELAFVILLGACAGAAFETWRPAATPKTGKLRGIIGRRSVGPTLDDR